MSGQSRVLKSPSINELILVCVFNFSSMLFVKLGIIEFFRYIFRIVISYFFIVFFIKMRCPFYIFWLLLVGSLFCQILKLQCFLAFWSHLIEVLLSILAHYIDAHLWSWNEFLINLRKMNFCLLIHSASMYILIGELKTLICKVFV